MSPTSLGRCRPVSLLHGPCPLPPFIQSLKNVVFPHLTRVFESEVRGKHSAAWKKEHGLRMSLIFTCLKAHLDEDTYIMQKAELLVMSGFSKIS